MKRVIVLLTFISIALCSFRIKNDTVVVEQVESDLPIIIRYDIPFSCVSGHDPEL